MLSRSAEIDRVEFDEFDATEFEEEVPQAELATVACIRTRRYSACALLPTRVVRASVGMPT